MTRCVHSDSDGQRGRARSAARVRAAVSLLSAALVFVLAGCGGDAEEAAAPAAQQETTARQNACPIDGCTVEIMKVEKAGSELRITWAANFDPDFSKNHIHVFWDTYTADEVSNDAAERGKKQGEWVPTGDYPHFVTEGVVSTKRRSGSTTLCVTAASRDHNVLDSSLVDLFDGYEVVIDAAPDPGGDSFSCETELGLRFSMERVPVPG